MRPFPLLHATKVFILAIVLSFGATDFSTARDINERTIYRRGHNDRPHESRPILSGTNRYRNDFRHERRVERRREYRQERRWQADRRRNRRHDVVREYRGNRDWQRTYGGDGFPSPVPGIGTYAGGLSAWRDPGNGIYFSRNNDGYFDYGDVNIDVDLGAYLGRPQILDV